MDKRRIGSLDFLRICAAYLLVCHHWQQVLGIHYTTGINYFGGESSFNFGYLVEFFYILSGFFAEYTFNEKRSFREFFISKISRLIPVLALSVVIYDLFVILYARIGGTEWFFPVEIDVWGSIITSLGMSAGWSFANPEINNPAYFVSVLILCHIFHFAIKKITAKNSWNINYAYICIILLSVSTWTFHKENAFFNMHSNRGYYCFFIGSLLARYYVRCGAWKLKHSIIGMLIIALWLYINISKPEWLKNSPYFVCAFVIYPTFVLLFLTEPIQRIFGFKIFALLGMASYTTYLFQVPLMLLVRILIQSGIHVDLSQRLYMRLFLLFMIVVGVIVYMFYEKPMAILLKKKITTFMK